MLETDIFRDYIISEEELNIKLSFNSTTESINQSTTRSIGSNHFIALGAFMICVFAAH